MLSKNKQMKIYLSFDIEEFDMPKEYGYDIPFADQIAISRSGLRTILDLLKKHKCVATFFSTVVFAQNNKDLIEELLREGHELASHTYYHSEFSNAHLALSKETLEREFKTKVRGLRMPRMAEVDRAEVEKAGYLYNSSVNPIFLPGRYNKLHIDKRVFKDGDMVCIPAGVTPIFRLPLFWLSFHNFPMLLYKFLLKRTVNVRGYATLYFHPWEFEDLKKPEYNFPFYVTRNTGRTMAERFEKLLLYINKNKWETDTYANLSQL